jgi:hypothetical protein
LFKDRIKYLGHWITSDGIGTDDEKIEAVKKWPIPQSREEVKQFLGFASFYRRFIHKFAQISEPLQKLLRGVKKTDPQAVVGSTKKKNKKANSKLPPFEWKVEQQDSFEALIDALTSAPVLAYADFTKPFELHTDAATSSGLGAVLYQQDDQGNLRVIAYASRSLSESERRYPAHKLEFLALKWAVTDKFADYLRGVKFVVKTDNNPLTYVLKSAKLDACGQRWAAALCDYDFDIVYKPATQLRDADALSRLPGDSWKKLVSSTVHAVCQGQLVMDFASSYGNVPPTEVCYSSVVAGHWDLDTWLKMQHSDSDIQEVVAVLSNNSKDVTSPEARNMLRQRKKLLVSNDGLLERHVKIDGTEVVQLVVPKNLQHEILKQLHDKMGHLGVDRTLELLRGRFYFPGMGTFTAEYIRKCDSCLRRKSKPQIAPMGRLESVGPMDMLCIDYLSLESSKGGYSNILVMTDHFTRYAQAVPTRDQTAKTTAKVLLDRFVNHYGLPRCLHSDQGAQFESHVIKQLCLMLGITKSHTTPYHAQGNAQTERFNSTLLSMLSCLPEEEKSRWKDQVTYVVHAYNCTHHESTGFSPFQLMFGRKPRLPVDIIKGLNENQTADRDYLQYVEKVRQSLKTAYEQAMQKSDKQHLRGKEAYDLRAHAPELELGDRVLVRKVRFKEGPHKLDHVWEKEVYCVVGIPSEDLLVFDVQEEGNKKARVRRLHRNLLLPLGHVPEPKIMKDSKPRPSHIKTKKKSQAPPSSDAESTDSSDSEVMVSQTRPRTRHQATRIRHSSDHQSRESRRQDVTSESEHVSDACEEQEASVREDSPEDAQTQDESHETPEPRDRADRNQGAAGGTHGQGRRQQHPPQVLQRSTRERKEPAWKQSGSFLSRVERCRTCGGCCCRLP